MWRAEPLVQAGTEVVAIELSQSKREMREGVCAVDQDRNVALAALGDDALCRQDLTGQVDHVSDQNQFGSVMLDFTEDIYIFNKV